MSYTHLELGIDYLPYWEESDTDNTDTETATETETNDINNIELPF